MRFEGALRSPEPDPALAQLPKCNLHTHLEGSIRPGTWWELAQAAGVDPGVPREEAEAALQVDGLERSLADYLLKISRTYPVLRTAEALRRAAFEAAEDAARDGVVYLELRAGPVTHAHDGLTAEKVIESLLEGLKEAEARVGIVGRLIVSALRHHPPLTNVRLAHSAVEFSRHGVVGFDLAGDEAAFPAHLHAEAFRVAARGGLGITVHAGEAGGPENVQYAVEELGASRIGHGVRSVQSEPVMDLLLERSVVLEVCPTSNVHTRAVPDLASHPIRFLFDRGMAVSIGDDDPTTSRTRVSRELTLLRQLFGFTWQELAAIQRAGLRGAFLKDEAVRRRLEVGLAASARGEPAVSAGGGEGRVE